jgi:hypothetical protein
VAVGASGLLLWRASSLHDQANTEPEVRMRVELHDQASARTLIGAVVGIGGIALTATGAAMLVTRSPDRRRAHAAWSIGIRGYSIAVAGHF